MAEDINESEFQLSEALERIPAIWRRRYRWIVGTGCLFPLTAIGVLFLIPNKYSSEATILVVQQKVPERYVVPTTANDISQALDAMTQEVLSRPRLLTIVNDLGLYAGKKGKLSPDELIDKMRDDVSIAPLQHNPEERDVNAFKISFKSADPRLARDVATRLTTLFIEENIKRRADQANTTTRFLKEQLQVAAQKLAEQEQRLSEYKMRYLGELPEQQQGNLGILGGLQGQLQNVLTNLNGAQQQRLYLQSLITEYRRIDARRTSVGGDGQIGSPMEVAQRDLARLQAERRELLTTYTSQHPEVLRKDQEIAVQRTLLESIKARESSGSKETVQGDTGSESTGSDTTIAQLKSQLEANRLQIANLNESEQKIRLEIDKYQGRLNLTPVREQELMSLLRDYDLLKQNYTDLLNKESQSQLATNLEKQQEGQQFRLADPPNLPSEPSSPKRLKISLGVMAGALFLGIVAGAFFEMKDSTFHSEKDAGKKFSPPIVVGIPVLLTDGEVKRRWWIRRLEWVAGCVLAVAVVAAEYCVYKFG